MKGAGFAERADLAGLEEAEQLRLQVEAELADFVEEQRAVAGGANEAGVVAVGAGEGAAAVAEQLALEQVARDGGAVEGDERLAAARSEKSWMARARISLPVPLSPVMRTLTFVGDACGRLHQFAHVPADDGVSPLEGDVVDGPEVLAPRARRAPG